MTTAGRLIGKWNATTDGERLFHFLAKNVGEFGALEHLQGESIADVIRGREFMQFAEGAIVLHSFGRLLQAAKWYRTQCVDNPEKALNAIEKFAIDTLGIAQATCSSFSELAPLALNAALAASKSSKTPSNREKRKVIENCKGEFFCYSCDGTLDPQAPSKILDEDGKTVENPLYLEYEHLWPHSFGGNSVAGNLLPSCIFCNRAKADIASWEWIPLQSVIPEFAEASTYINTCDHNNTRQLKIGLHIKVAMAYAKNNGTTLKDAYGFVGPRLKETFLVDVNDTADFFNLRVHNLELT